jgi:hypothetical protein
MPIDPKGYYAILGVAVSASAAEIKHAFRHRAIALHPDTSKAPNAVEMFVRLKEAYETLSNRSRRAAYDIWQTSDDDEEDEETPTAEAETEPMQCSVCSKVTAQPRYVIFPRVRSYIFGSSRTSAQGIFCSECATKEALRASATTWLLGWWAVPFGPFYTVHALVRNLLGGIKPRDINARIAAHQAWHFVSVNQMELARAVATDALRLANAKTREAAELKASVLRVLDLTADRPTRRLRDSWPLFGVPFVVQAAPMVAVLMVAAHFVFEAVSVPSAAPDPVARTATTLPKPPPRAPANEPTPGPPTPRYVRPPIADNGVPWPTVSAYIPGYPRRFTEGRSSLQVDNSKNDADMFVKIFKAATTPRVLARAFFVQAGGQFKVESLESGEYDLRYRNLRTGAHARLAPLDFKEIPAGDSVKVTTMRVTLYEIADGTLRVQPIPDEDFD